MPMKDPDRLRIEHNNRAASTALPSINIALPDGLYVIPAEPVEEWRQPDELLIKWIAGGLLGIALALMLAALFPIA
jgi:hypothetical protein